MKIGLVLEGGGMRGMYTAGVLDVMLENEIKVDAIMGASAGAVFGCNYKSRQIGRTIRYNKRFCRDPRYSGIRSFIKTGDFFGAKFCYDDIPNKLDIFDARTFNSTPEKFYAVCTDVLTGKPVYRELSSGDGNDLTWLRASASMPLVSHIVEADGYKLLDGGMADSIPIEKLMRMGYEKNIVVLTQPQGYRKKPAKLLPLIKIVYAKYPSVIKAMAERHTVYNEELDFVKKQEEGGNAFVFAPSRLLKVKRTEHDPKVLQSMYDLGREDASARLDFLKFFVSNEDFPPAQNRERQPAYE
ncbi:patatin family protein [Treponema parvum]|uniref:Patatin family protein n=1 Tax=Treponema parvum TaxID=138851 RepID=A0A975F1M7_9SPIR|nr:patatin family protein [Treponema parvum]QTQ12429.1 patatin family protein [Treponema parvum]QTQ15579.1 patatin family protein [Treponema parvum]